VHVIIVGAGEVGWYLAERLGGERHDVVVVEQDEQIAAMIREELDVQVVVGNACHPSVLMTAGVDRAALLAGVTQSDEVNLIASLIAKQHGVVRTVVRIQTEELRGPVGEGVRSAVGADLVIDPDADTAAEIMEVINLAGADEVYPMVGGQLTVLGTVIRPGSPLEGRSLSEIGTSFEPHWEFLFGVITRRGQSVIPRGDEALEAGDHVRVLTTREAQRATLALLGTPARRVRRLMVLGGGAVGSQVAAAMSRRQTEVVLVERDLARAEHLAAALPRVRVIHGDIADIDLLRDESVATMDVVVAATGEDTSNVIACAFAAEGDAFTVAVLHRLALLPMVTRFGIDATLSPRTASANAVLQQVRGGGGSVATFLESDVEVNEFVVQAGSPADGSVVAEMHIPRSILLGAVVRVDQSVEIIRGPTRLLGGDRVVVFSRARDLSTAREIFGP
jgi:trk system potassium uptake protein TrkA